MPLRGDDEEELLDVDCKIEGQEMMEKCFYPDESRQKSRTLLFFSLSSSSKKNGFRMLVRIRTRKNGNIPLFCRKTGRKRRVFFQKEEGIGILTSIAGNKKG